MFFGVTFLTKIPPKTALNMAKEIILYTFKTKDLIQSVTPLFSGVEKFKESGRFRGETEGDVACKSEAREMIEESKEGEGGGR